MIPSRLSHIMSLFWHSGLVKKDFFQPMEYHGQYLSFPRQTLVELNSNILVRDVERMANVSQKYPPKCDQYIFEKLSQVVSLMLFIHVFFKFSIAAVRFGANIALLQVLRLLYINSHTSLFYGTWFYCMGTCFVYKFERFLAKVTEELLLQYVTLHVSCGLH